MNRFLGLAVLLLPLAAAAQSGVDGTWKIDLSKAKMDSKPMVYELKNGTYTCSSCDPKISIPANGEAQKIEGSPYSDTQAVTVVNPNTIERVGMKDGKVSFRDTLTVSPDGKTLTQQYEGHPASGGETVMVTGTYSRVGTPEAGAHAISGQWKTERYESVSDNALTFHYTMGNNGLQYKASTGESYTAQFDGKDYPFHGDPGTTAVSLKKIDDHTFQETYKRNGEVIATAQITVSPDGKSLTVANQDLRRGTHDTWVAERQGGDAMADK